MYICLCKRITDHQIQQLIAQGASDLRELQAALGVTTECNTCLQSVLDLLAEAHLPSLPPSSAPS